MMKKKAAEKYIKGEITMSKAAELAELALWEMETFLVEQGYKSGYSIEDLNNELRILADQTENGQTDQKQI